MMYCAHCGTALPGEARFCTVCGKATPAMSAPAAEAVVPSNARAFRPSGTALGNPRVVTKQDRFPGRWSGLFTALRWIGGIAVALVVALIIIGLAVHPSKSGTNAAADAPVSDDVKSEAVNLLGAAIYKREEGELGLAIELARQALGKWPSYADAQHFLDDVGPQATATAASRSQASAPVQAKPAATATAATSGASSMTGALTEQGAVARVLPAVIRVATNTSVGSGVIVSADGKALTNAHVVGNNRNVSVRLQDGRTLNATITKADAQQDIAVLQIGAKSLPTASFADLKQLQIGEPLIAIGYALDLQGGPSVTRGIYSAARTLQGVRYVQTDTPINPGNSGGPLISLRGEVVGINTFGLRRDQGIEIQGLNFAISSDTLRAYLGGASNVAAAQVAPNIASDAQTTTGQFYGLITAKRFDQAYAFLSAAVRSEYPLDRFTAAYADVQGIEPLQLRVDRADASGATEWACLRVNRTAGSKILAGNIQLVREQGAFRIGASELREVASCS